MVMSPLSTLTAALQTVTERARARPPDWLRLLPLQAETLADASKIRLIRHGNQTIGKTVCGVLDLVGTATGVHLWCPEVVRVDRPVDCLVIFADKSQSIGIQRKIFELIPKELLHPDTRFDPARGLVSRAQTFKVRHIPTGGWSIVRFKTVEQGPMALAGLTCDYVWIDEPPTPEVFDEALRRLQQAGRWGRLLLTMTPINRPCEWIRERVAKGMISEHWRPLTPPELIPQGSQRPICTEDGVPKDQAWIDTITREVPDWLAPVRIHGEWETRVVERVFSAFRSGGAQSHVHEREPEVESIVCLGIDHGSKIGKQVVVLVLVVPAGPKHAGQTYILDEDIDDAGDSTPQRDAQRILAMLDRNDLTWSDVDQVWGDRLYLRGPADRKSNRDLQVAVARELGERPDQLHPSIRTVKRGAGHGRGSVDAGIRWLHHAMIEPDAFGVHPRCTHLIECIDHWDYRDTDWKDPIDAVRYALDTFIFAPQRRGANAKIVAY